MTNISIIVAMDEKRGIGKGNSLMWHISEELKRFKAITMDHPIIMGRKTHQSIGRPLPGRTNIVITHDKNLKAEGCIVTNSLEEAIAVAKKKEGSDEIFIIGGEQIYQQALSLAEKLYLTIVQGDFKADVFFPDYSDFNKKISESDWQQSNNYRYKFIELEKIDG